MNAKTLGELALKIWGVTLLISALASLPVILLAGLLLVFGREAIVTAGRGCEASPRVTP